MNCRVKNYMKVDHRSSSIDATYAVTKRKRKKKKEKKKVLVLRV